MKATKAKIDRAPTEQDALERLLALGAIKTIKQLGKTIRDEHDPIPIEGKPVSELLIEERR